MFFHKHDTGELWLIRDRARPYACMSVSRVCTLFHGAAFAIFLAQVCKHRLASVLPTLCLSLQERSSARTRAFLSSTCIADT